VVVAGDRVEQRVGAQPGLGQPLLQVRLDVIALGVQQKIGDPRLDGNVYLLRA
jgi:hypothetical protein